MTRIKFDTKNFRTDMTKVIIDEKNDPLILVWKKGNALAVSISDKVINKKYVAEALFKLLEK